MSLGEDSKLRKWCKEVSKLYLKALIIFLPIAGVTWLLIQAFEYFKRLSPGTALNDLFRILLMFICFVLYMIGLLVGGIGAIIVALGAPLFLFAVLFLSFQGIYYGVWIASFSGQHRFINPRNIVIWVSFAAGISLIGWHFYVR